MTPLALEQRRAAIRAGQAVSHARTRSSTDSRIERLERLAADGIPLETAVKAVGWTITAAHSALRRRQHPLARQLSRLVTQQRRRSA